MKSFQTFSAINNPGPSQISPQANQKFLPTYSKGLDVCLALCLTRRRLRMW